MAKESKLESYIKPMYPKLTPSEVEKTLVADIFNRFKDAESIRNRNYNYFDKRNLIDYINDSVLRFVTNKDEREGIEDWQARVNDPFTRNKVLAILGKLISILPMAQFIGRGDEDFRKGQLATNIYEYSEELDDYEEFMINFLLEAIVKGTAIGYENVEVRERKLRDVIGANDDITIKEVTEKIIALPAIIVKLEDFYPAGVNYRNIKLMPYCFWRSEIPYSEFVANWSQFEKSKYVQPKQSYSGETNQRPYFADYISTGTQEGNVEILRFYDKVYDRFVIIANGLWLNPIKVKGDKEEVSPLPYNHKELPFFDVKFDFFGADFFYGKSLPDRLKSLQDVLNVLTNMLLDQSFLSIFAPMLTSGFDDVEDDYLRPGRRIAVDTQGLPLSQSFVRLESSTPGGWHQFILEYTRKVMEQSSVDQVTQGVAGVGERTTAQEIRVAAEGVTNTLGLFATLIRTAVKRKALLKLSNAFQFWLNPDTPMIQRIEGENGAEDFNQAFATFKINNAVLTSGRRGAKIIEFYRNKKSLPTKATLKAKAVIMSAEAKRPVEIEALLPNYIRNFRPDVKLVTNPRSEGTREVEKALQLEKVRIYKSFFPNLIDDMELAATTMEKMGDDPSKLLNPDVLNPTPQENNPELDKGLSQTPTGNTANNMVRGMKGGTGESNLGLLSTLQNNITG